MVEESFSFSSLNPVNDIKSILKRFLWFMIHVVVAGIIMYVVMQKVGLMDDQTMQTYIKYLVIGSIVMYTLTFAYLIVLSKRKDVKIDYTKLAKISILGPSTVALHVIILFASAFLQVVPEVGMLVYMLVWSSFGATLVSGAIYSTGLSIAEIKEDL